MLPNTGEVLSGKASIFHSGVSQQQPPHPLHLCSHLGPVVRPSFLGTPPSHLDHLVDVHSCHSFLKILLAEFLE